MSSKESDRSDSSSVDNEESEVPVCVACEKSDEPGDFVACDKCAKWWHFSCAGVDATVANKDWMCPRCLPSPPPASIRSTTSSRKADLQRKRLAEQQELEAKQLELERKQLELQMKHSKEKFELEESLADEADNRSVRSRVIEIEAREKQVQDWVDKHNSEKQKSTEQSSDTTKPQPTPPNKSGAPTIDDGNKRSGLQEEATNTGIRKHSSSIQQYLKEHLQNQPATVDTLLLMETEIRKFRLQMAQSKASGKEVPGESIPRPDTSKGAIPKTVPTVRDNRNTNQGQPGKSKTTKKLIGIPVPDPTPRNRKESLPKIPEESCIPSTSSNPPSHSTSVPHYPSPATVPASEAEDENRTQTPIRHSNHSRSSSRRDEQQCLSETPLSPPSQPDSLSVHGEQRQCPPSRGMNDNRPQISPLHLDQRDHRMREEQPWYPPFPIPRIYQPDPRLDDEQPCYSPQIPLPRLSQRDPRLMNEEQPWNPPQSPLPHLNHPDPRVMHDEQPWYPPQIPIPRVNQPDPRPVYDEQLHYPPARSNSNGLGGNPLYNQHPLIPPRFPDEPNLRRPLPEQLAARQVMPRDLPDFSGDPEEWPIFYSSFCHSSAACGFNNVENLARLQRCLKGNALKSVRYYLLSPESVPDVIDTLQTLFGRPEVIINKLIRNVQDTPAPKPEKLEALIDFGMSVRNLTQHLVAAGQEAHLSNPALLQELVEKLPANIKLQWAQHIMFQREASLRTFSNFMATVVESVSKVVIYTSSQPAKNDSRGKDKGFIHAHTESQVAVMPAKGKAESEKPCLFCGKGGHRLKDCTKFQQLSVDDRWKNVQSLKVCRSCLNPHGRRTCRLSNRCGIDGCQFRHHQLLHGKPDATAKKLAITSAESHVDHHCGQSILFRIIPVTLYGNSKSITVFAFLDEGSSATLIERSLVEELGVKGHTVPLCLKWTGNMTRTEEESQVVTLEVSEIDRTKRFQLVNVRTVGDLNLPSQTLHFADLQESHPHLKGLPVKSYEGVTPKLLVGLRNLQLAVPQKIKEGHSGIVAAKTRLGWCVYGNLDPVQQPDEHNYHVCECEAEERLDRLMKEYFNAEDCGVNHPNVLESDEDKRARKIMEETTSKVGDRFETGLLWRTDYVEMPDSYSMALRRLECLEKRMERDPILKESIHRQIMEYQEKGYAHRATEDELAQAVPRRIWYLPLGAVCNPKKVK